jgi:hypothetical protein
MIGVDLFWDALGKVGEDAAFVVGGEAELEAGGGLESTGGSVWFGRRMGAIVMGLRKNPTRKYGVWCTRL